jgi:phosphoserine phosphatase RsbU/P
MDERLNHAPCGYLSLTEDHNILAVNQTLLSLLGYDREALSGCRFESILTRSSRIFYQIYFFPLIRLNGKVEEMYLTLRAADGLNVPVLLNAVRREQNGVFFHECVLLALRRRLEYEEQIAKSEKAAEKAKKEVLRLQRELQDRQMELHELEAELHAKQKELQQLMNDKPPPT